MPGILPYSCLRASTALHGIGLLPGDSVWISEDGDKEFTKQQLVWFFSFPSAVLSLSPNHAWLLFRLTVSKYISVCLVPKPGQSTYPSISEKNSQGKHRRKPPINAHLAAHSALSARGKVRAEQEASNTNKARGWEQDLNLLQNISASASLYEESLLVSPGALGCGSEGLFSILNCLGSTGLKLTPLVPSGSLSETNTGFEHWYNAFSIAALCKKRAKHCFNYTGNLWPWWWRGALMTNNKWLV